MIPANVIFDHAIIFTRMCYFKLQWKV